MAKKKQPNTIQRLLDRVDRFGEQQTDWLTEAYSKIDAECSALVLEICLALRPQIVVTRVICGMGSYTYEGAKLTCICRDDEEEYSIAIARFFNEMSGFDGWRPPVPDSRYDPVKGLTVDKYTLAYKMHMMISEWVQITGGDDVVIPACG